MTDHTHKLMTDLNDIDVGMSILMRCTWCDKRHHGIIGNPERNLELTDCNGEVSRSPIAYLLMPTPSCLSSGMDSFYIDHQSVSDKTVYKCVDPVWEKEKKKAHLVFEPILVGPDGIEDV